MSKYKWKVSIVKLDYLEKTLNSLEEQGFEIFSITSSVKFGAKLMGTPVPSENTYTIIARGK